MPSHPHIPGCARLNVMRLNAARLNFYEPLTFAIIGGADRSVNVRIEGAAIDHVLNDEPDTGAVRVHRIIPTAGMTFELYSGDRSVNQQIFGGRILATTTLYESRKENVATDLQLIDPTWLLNRRRVLARYVGVGAMHVLLDVINRFAPSVPGTDFQIGNPVLDEITFTNETVASVITAVCERIGAYWYLDYAGILHVFFDTGIPAAAITDAEPRGASDLALSEDLSQVVTRVLLRGGGSQAAVDVAGGAAEIPVDDPGWFSPAGGVVEAVAQRVEYMGVRGQAGTGALVGVALAPTSAPLATPMGSTSPNQLPAGTYLYALTFANATGETLPSTTASVTLGGTAPTLLKTVMRPGYYQDYQGKTTGGQYSWRIALHYEGGGYALGPPTDYTVVTDRRYEIYVGLAQYDPVSGYAYYPALMSGTAARIDATYVYRTVDGGVTWYQEQFWANVNFGTWLDVSNQMTDADLLGENRPYPPGPIATFNAARVSGFQTLPQGFTSRKLYRSTINSAGPLKLRATDPADPLTDYAADATLGANAPSTDTSGVVAGGSQTVPVGSTTIPVTDTAPFAADGGTGGGWARVGGLAIRYGGISAGSRLAGIPATGVGALTTEVRHGTQIVVLARLVGVPASGTGALVQAIKRGDAITLRVELDDVPAQVAFAARLGSGDPADGVVEEVFSDSRMTLVELLQYGRALLLERKDPRRTLRFVTRDDSVDVGRLITVNVASPPISGTFRIQRVGFDEIAISGGLARVAPRRTVEASNKLYTFADLLRRLRGREGGAG